MPNPIQVVFTDQQFIAYLQDIAEMYPTAYDNNFPYNCGYFTGNEWTFDCWNLIKSVIWGWIPDTTIGYYCYHPDLYGLPDVNGIQLLNMCSGISNDFNNIQAGEYMYLNDTIDHAGIYIGNYVYGGLTYNVVEATPIWNNGVQYSYVDGSGTRYQYLGGGVAGTWTSHGKLPWISYGGSPTPSRRKLPIWMLLRYHF